MRALVKAESGEEDDSAAPDVHSVLFHEVDYVVRTWLEHRLHHTYPDSGGYNDQDELLMKDWHTLSMYYLRASKGVFSDLVIDDDALPFSSMGRD